MKMVTVFKLANMASAEQILKELKQTELKL